MNSQNALHQLKGMDLSELDVSLAIVKEYKRKHISQYNVLYVPINMPVEEKLRQIMADHISNANTITAYSYDQLEPADNEVQAINYEETDFQRILQKLSPLNPEQNIVADEDELVRAKSYMIIISQNGDIKTIGFRVLPENWKAKKAKGFISLMYRDRRLEDLDSNPVFSIAKNVDFIFHNNYLLIISKKLFEVGLNFRQGMIRKAEDFYQEVNKSDIFINLDVLKNMVGDNLRYLKKIATVKNLGFYNDAAFLQNMKTLSADKNWGITFEDKKIVLDERNLDDVLSILQNKRLHSELTQEDFDVDSVRPL